MKDMHIDWALPASLLGRTQRLICATSVAIIVAGMFPNTCFGQTPAPPQPAFRIGSTQVDESQWPMVTLYVTVVDPAGKPVTTIAPSEFQVREDGQLVSATIAAEGQDRPVDIVFVIDITGSMRRSIDGVKQTCIAFAKKLAASGRDYRLGIVGFRDSIEPADIFGRSGVLTNDVLEFQRWIGSLVADGGNLDPEMSLDAAKYAATKTNFRKDAQRVLLLITDAPPHHRGDDPVTRLEAQSELSLDDLISIVRDSGATLYTIAGNETIALMPGKADKFPDVALATGGKHYQIGTDFTGIIDDLGTTLVSQYKITYRSPSPSRDGRRRDIDVTIGKSGSGSASYLQRTLLNVRSASAAGVLVFLVCLVALTLMLVTPPVARSLLGIGRQIPRAQGRFCQRCGSPTAPTARFCGRCGQQIQG